MNLGDFWGFVSSIFGKMKRGNWLKSLIFQASPKIRNFLKTAVHNITMSQGTADYSVKGNLVYPAVFSRQSASSMVIFCSVFRKVSKIKGRGQKKTYPDLVMR